MQIMTVSDQALKIHNALNKLSKSQKLSKKNIIVAAVLSAPRLEVQDDVPVNKNKHQPLLSLRWLVKATV